MLTTEQLAQYQRDGYTLIPLFLKGEEIRALLSDIELICAGNSLAKHDKSRLEMEPNQPPDGARVRRVYEPCTHYPCFRALSESEQLLRCVEQLLGPNLLFHDSKINMKPPTIGSVVEWHQDVAYYPLTNHDSVAALFYLDDATSSNGCLQVIPGSHRAPLLNHTRDGFFQGRITDPVDASRAVYVEGGGRFGDLPALHDPSCLDNKHVQPTTPDAHPQLPCGGCLSHLCGPDDA